MYLKNVLIQNHTVLHTEANNKQHLNEINIIEKQPPKSQGSWAHKFGFLILIDQLIF